jgi:hypothetical protein
MKRRDPELVTRGALYGIVTPHHHGRGLRGLEHGNPAVGWTWYLGMTRESRMFKGPVFKRREQAGADLNDVMIVLAK